MINNLINTNSHNRLVAGSNPAEPTIEAKSSLFGDNSFLKVAVSYYRLR